MRNIAAPLPVDVLLGSTLSNLYVTYTASTRLRKYNFALGSLAGDSRFLGQEASCFSDLALLELWRRRSCFAWEPHHQTLVVPSYI